VTGAVTPVVRETATGLTAAGKFPTGATMDRTGAFLEISTMVVPRLRVSAGGRWSGFRTRAEVGTEFGGAVENTASALTGQGGLVLSVTQSLDAVARVAQGFRAPNLYDLTNIGAVPGGVVIPNPDAKPERSLSYEAGVRVHTQRTAAEVTAYRTLIHDFIDRAPASMNGDTLLDGERVFQGQNVGEARLWGVEAEAAHALGRVDARATLLYTYGQQTLGDGTREPMSKIPPLAGTLRLRWLGAAGRWWAGYQLAWAGRQDRLSSRDLGDSRIAPGGTHGYAVHSLLASVAVTPVLSASLGFENLTNTLYRTHASGVDAPGRHVWVGVRFFQ
jgi:hemoglobin/transferrin/lactoferrin receptor protein